MSAPARAAWTSVHCLLCRYRSRMLTSLMTRIAFALLLLALAAPANASAAVSGDWGRWTAEAARFRVPLPVAYIHTKDCPETDAARACAYPTRGVAWMPSDADRFTLAHELGHLWDGQFLTSPDREWLRRVMRAPDGDWWAEKGASEWFADFYADCAIGNDRESQEGYADRPTPRRLRRVCTAIRTWGMLRS